MAGQGALPYPLEQGGFRLRTAIRDGDLEPVRRLRAVAFGETGRSDPLDANADLLLIEESATGEAIGTLRLISFPSAGALPQAYSARFYDLTSFGGVAFPATEISRFCLRPGSGMATAPGALRFLWGALMHLADRLGTGTMFGVSTLGPAPLWQAERGRAALGRLVPRIGPAALCPPARGAAVGLAAQMGPADPLPLPPLLLSYLAAGGWVAPEAAFDGELGTLVIFTTLERRLMSAARMRSLRAMAVS